MKNKLLPTLALVLASVASVPAAHAANILNGISINGISINGISINGTHINGLKQNGQVINGFVVNGFVVNGLYTNGLGLNGTRANGPTDTDAKAFTSVQLPNGQSVELN